MGTERNNEHRGNYGSIVFTCDEVTCDQQHDTEYTTWDYAKEDVKRAGWYIMPDGRGGWDHFCPAHGKARYIEQKRAEEPSTKADLPWLKNKPVTVAEALKVSNNRCPRCSVPILESERSCPDCHEYLFDAEDE